eukprot:symbB.v1.2.004324.t1/scaffold188.1/size279614/13
MKEILEYLVSQGADLNKENDSGQTPLSIAVKNEQLKVADLLKSAKFVSGRIMCLNLAIAARPPQPGQLQPGDKVSFQVGQRLGHGRIVRIDKDHQVHVDTVHGTEVFSDAKSLRKAAAVVGVVGPGAGVGSIGNVEMVGRKGMPYDRYPDTWQSGGPAPNLQSFGEDVVRIGVHRRVDCFLFGSRGGQVVLPILWQSLQNATPPRPPICWPERAVTVMLLGGQDFFRTGISRDEYLQRTLESVPDSNQTTAFLFVPEMKHMPQEQVARAALRHLIFAALAWIPLDHLGNAAEALLNEGFAGFLCFKSARSWSRKYFGQMPPDRQPPPLSPRIPRPPGKPCPPYTSVSMFPARVAVGDSKEGHERFALEAQRLAGTSLGSLQNALMEFAEGQDAEAWAAEDDRIMKELKDQAKEKQKPASKVPPQQAVQTVGAVRASAPCQRWVPESYSRPLSCQGQPFVPQVVHAPQVQPRPVAYPVLGGATSAPPWANVPQMQRSFPPSFPRYR